MKINVKLPSLPSLPPPEKPGELAPDGSIYLGQHKGRHWFVAAKHLENAYEELWTTFNHAAIDTRKLRAHNHDDWTIPDRDILQLMYKHRDDGAFRDTYYAARYWASPTEDQSDMAPIKDFSLWGDKFSLMGKGSRNAVRCVRSVPV